ncbi:MAG: GNAT family N-acetyltransferase [Rubrobacter sp.]|nr:GNAT family N-acetyltransferase [Rubrobacter sp.]
MARAVFELQRRSYAVEAEIIGSRELPPLHETLEDLRSSGEDFHGCFIEGTLAGAISTKKSGDILDIHRLFVGLEYFRRGIASSMLRHVEGAEEWEKITVSTGAENAPAKGLYLSRGFVEVGEDEVVPGLFVARFEKEGRRRV